MGAGEGSSYTSCDDEGKLKELVNMQRFWLAQLNS